MSEEELTELLPQFDAWIIGDDPATRLVLAAGATGKLRVAVKWGVGVDNVDQAACRDLGIAFSNTPNMFGQDVADLATHYVIGLARSTFLIDRGVREGGWPKPRGISLAGKTCGVVGFGDIGRETAIRLRAFDMKVVAYDPMRTSEEVGDNVELRTWPDGLEDCHFLVLTCALTKSSRNMLNARTLSDCLSGVRIVNVARGGLLDEPALQDALASGKVHSVALDVFEREPLPADSPLRTYPNCIFGSHNASNTEESVVRASERAISLVETLLEAHR